jgi:hypothetical protein
VGRKGGFVTGEKVVSVESVTSFFPNSGWRKWGSSESVVIDGDSLGSVGERREGKEGAARISLSSRWGDVGPEERAMVALNDLRSRDRHKAPVAKRVWIRGPGKF